MNRLERFRFGNVHKRRVVRSMVVVTGMFAVSLLVLAGLGIFSSRSELVRIKLSSSDNGRSLDGVGINLEQIPCGNRVRNSDFEQSDSFRSMTIVDASEDYLYFDPGEGIADADLRTGSEIRVLSLDSDGVMSARYSGLVNDVDEARFGLLTEIEDTEGYWIGEDVVKTVALDSTVDALTAEGSLILDITSVQLTKVFDDADVFFTDICSSDTLIYALADNGDIYVSNDGRNFDLYASGLSDDNSALVPVSIVCAGSSPVVDYSDGSVMVYSQGVGRKLTLTFDTTGLITASDGTSIYMITSEGEMYVTSNGYIYSRIDTNGALDGQTVVDHDCCSGKICILTESGKMVTVRYDAQEQGYITEDLDIAFIEPEHIAVSNEGNVIVVTSDKKACLISPDDGRVSDLTSNAGAVDDVIKGASDRMITVSGNNLYLVSVLSGIRVNTPIPEESVLSGDLCIIGDSSVSDEYWETIGEGTTLTYYDAGISAAVSDSCGRIIGTGDHLHAIYQPLYGMATDNFSDNTFYCLSALVRSDSTIRNVKIWVSGDTFGEVGIDIDDVGNKMKEYTTVFAVTGNMLADETLRINISFEGEGIVYVDDIYLGEDRYEKETIPEEFSSAVINSKPSTMRFSNIVMCSNDFSEELFYGTGCESLESSMQLAKSADALPWFVIGSYADLTAVDTWLDYMCGSVKSDYGRLRIDNGTAVPWSRQFDTIYIEITDIDGAFESDMQRGSYVSYVMGLITQSRYYSEVKDKLVFLDGMTYEGGTVLSAADYHTMDMSINLLSSVSGRNDIIGQAFENLNYDAPRFPSRSADSGEFIRSLDIVAGAGDLTAGEVVSALSNDSVRMIMIDIDVSPRPVDTENADVFSSDSQRTILNTLPQIRFLRHSDSLYYELSDPMDSEAQVTSAEFNSECSVMLLSSGDKVYLIVSNTSDVQQQYLIEGVNMTLDNAVVRRYSSEGNLLTTRRLSRNDVRHTLQAGEFSVIEIGGSQQ